MRRRAAVAVGVAAPAAAAVVLMGCGGSGPTSATTPGEGVTSAVVLRATYLAGDTVQVQRAVLAPRARLALPDGSGAPTGCVQQGRIRIREQGRPARVVRDGQCFAAGVTAPASLVNAGSREAAVFITTLGPPGDGTASTGEGAPSAEQRARAVARTGTINGGPVPGVHTNLLSSTVALDTTIGGMRHLYFLDRRAAGTRAPIHVHPTGGITCVKEGQATLYQQGADPRTVTAGQCFWMTESTPMANSNRGSTTAVLFDQFILPRGAAYWRIIEPGAENMTHGLGDPGKLPY